MERTYLCIDLKSFFASVECVERGLDPMKTSLAVADPSRGDGAICLAISPYLKTLGVRNRCRIFEIPKTIDYIVALPRMKYYIQYAADIYGVYLKYVSKDDIHVYSIDEAFLDVTEYLKLYELDAIQLAKKITQDVLTTVGITATVGIGPNLYLAKIALDIMAKRSPDYVGYLTIETYQKQLWKHRPITDFWQVGRGIAKRLEKYGVFDMQGVVEAPEKLLYQEFGVNAEYLIDHAHGIEPTTIADIKAYAPKHNSISNSQILFEDYWYEDARLVLKEMVELNVLSLVERSLVTNQIGLYIGYSNDAIKHSGGSRKIAHTTNSYAILVEAFLSLFNQTTNRLYPIRQIAIRFADVEDECHESYDLFTDYEALKKEKDLQHAIIDIKHKFGKNAVLKGMNCCEKATTKKRNMLIGGHNAQ